jgi:hypothetical protein
MRHVTRFMKIGTGVQAILRFRLRYLRGFNIGITGRRDLVITPLMLAQVPCIPYFVDTYFRHSRVIKGEKHTDTQTARRSHEPKVFFQNRECRLKMNYIKLCTCNFRNT